MHKQDNTNRDKGLESIMESMYTAAALEPLSEKTVTCDKCKGEGCDHCNGTGKHVVKEEDEVCPKCGKVHTINASSCGAHEAIDDDTGRIPHDVDSFKGPDDQDNTSYQVPAELDAAVAQLWDGEGKDGDFIEYINTIEWTDEGAAALVEWINRYNLGAS